jgi:predicted hydrocarbon binding protein
MSRPEAAQHSILPLAVLEAMRNLDAPGDNEAEIVDELLKKRLGLSDTVAAQITRYRDVVGKDGAVPGVELEQILRLAGRRTDAALVFAEAGRRAARRALGRVSTFTHWGARHLPGTLRHAIGFRGVRSVADDVFDAALARDGHGVTARVSHALAAQATPDGTACAFYASAFAELLRQLFEYEGTLTHSRCRSRGDPCCEWQSGPDTERRT